MSGSDFLELVSLVCLVILCGAFALVIVRIIRGPTLGDRTLALDMLTVVGMCFVCIIAVRTGLSLYLDIAIALALLGFMSTVALSRYIKRRAIARRRNGAGETGAGETGARP